MDDRLGKAKNELEKLRSTRTNVMERKLREVGTLDVGESERVLEISGPSVAEDGSEGGEPVE